MSPKEEFPRPRNEASNFGRKKSVLALVTEAYGGHGGIALYMRDVLGCLAGCFPHLKVTLLARVGTVGIQAPPEAIDWKTGALGGKISFLKALFEALASVGKPTFILCGHINLLPVAALAALWFRVPVVLFIYGIDAWKRPNRFLAGRLLRKLDVIISISGVTRTRFLAWAPVTPERVLLLPNAVDLDLYGLGPKNLTLVERYGLKGKTVLMTLGRLATIQRHKGIDEILAALPLLLRQFPNLVYLVVGGGDDIARLQGKADQLGLNAHVILTGLIPESEKADHYRLADAFALAGRGDGFGFVLLEAMACGTPVVASLLDGSREAVRDGELGRLVNPDDQQDLVRGIAAALSSPRHVPQGLDYFSYPKFCQRLSTHLKQYLEPLA